MAGCTFSQISISNDAYLYRKCNVESDSRFENASKHEGSIKSKEVLDVTACV